MQHRSPTLLPLPKVSRMRWRRLDAPGHEEARIERADDGWRLHGSLEVTEDGVAARLRYSIAVDDAWRTRRANVHGELDARQVRIDLESDGEGHWKQDGVPLPAVDGAPDVDLGFTPATNTLPIRRLELAIGETRAVRSAWLRFPELRLEPLEQTYTRESARVFRYVAQVDGAPFTARLDTDGFGRVLRYEGLWEADFADPADDMPAR